MPTYAMTVKPEHKSCATHLRRAIPGATVHRYLDQREENAIDVFIRRDEGGMVVATIGLMAVDQSRDPARPILSELLLDVRRIDERLANVLSTAAFFILKDGWRVAPGVVFEDIVQMYLPEVFMKHLLFVPRSSGRAPP